MNPQNDDGDTALISAAARANLDEIKILMAAGADPKMKDNKNRLAAEIARAGSKNYPDANNQQRFAETLKLLKLSIR